MQKNKIEIFNQGGYVTPSVECFEIVAEQCFAESVVFPEDGVTEEDYVWGELGI